MKILVISDSHMYNDILIKIINSIKCDLIIHCGDSSLPQNDPLLKRFITVRGNHDEDFLPFTQEITLVNKKCLITHGHRFNIYAGYETLCQYMEEHNYDLCFHGHTHVPHHVIYQGKEFINPGSTMFNRGEFGLGSFAIVEMTQNNISVQFYDSKTLMPLDDNILENGNKILEEFKNIIKK